MSSAVGPIPTKSESKIVLLGVDDATADVLVGCFRQFGIDAVALPESARQPHAGNYSACVVPLNGDAEPVLAAIRKASHRTVLYAVCGSVRQALKYSKYGINAVFHTPVRIQDALQVVRATHLLVLKELRRYVRVPLVCSVELETGTEKLEGSTVEISAGGMSLMCKGHLVVPQTVLTRFAVPGAGTMEVRSVVCWTRHEEGMVAIRFDPSDDRRVAVSSWINDYLGT